MTPRQPPPCSGLLSSGSPVLVAQGWWLRSGAASGRVGLGGLTGCADLAS